MTWGLDIMTKNRLLGWQVHVQSVRPRELPAGGADHVPRAHSGGVPGGRGADHAAHVGRAGEPGADAGVPARGGGEVRARVAGLRARERERRHTARDGAGNRAADGGQPALDARAARADWAVPRVHQRVQPGRADPPAVHRVLGRHGQGKRRLLQPRDRCRAALDRSGESGGERGGRNGLT